MLHIQIIQVGKTKEKFFQEAENEFLKRLSRYAKITIDTVAEKGSDDGKKIIKKIRNDSFVIVLDIKGVQHTSEEFAHLLDKIMMTGKVTFVIGGPHGLSEDVLERADLKLSFSKMTFTHQMIRLFLLEQIYRGFTILEGKTYHY
jgi:23S rRNA (pseudouridine1915-N3)-methyltransferase